MEKAIITQQNVKWEEDNEKIEKELLVLLHVIAEMNIEFGLFHFRIINSIYKNSLINKPDPIKRPQNATGDLFLYVKSVISPNIILPIIVPIS